MTQAKLRLLFLGLAAGGLLSGCVDGASGGGETTTAAPALFGGAKSGSREVEAPEVFQVTDAALWDGRPSLGGIWVASPDVTSPERVVMVNLSTGTTVNGALFKRERDNPGPSLQISSDAAEALGILAGQPTEIRVTALRKEEVEAPPETVTETAVAEGAAPAADPAAAETAALATAALDAAEGVAPAATDASGAAVDGAAPVETASVEPPKKKTWKERRAEAKAKREAEKAAKAAAAVAAEAGTTGVPLDAVDPAASAVASVETAPLDGGAAPAPAEEPARRVVGDSAAPAPAAAPASDEAAPAAGALRPIQIASFSKEENANRAVQALAKIGVTAQPQKSEKSGTAVWGVVAQGDGALLKKIKDAGFADAYFLQ